MTKNTNADIISRLGLTPKNFTISEDTTISGQVQGAPFYVTCTVPDEDGDRTWGHFATLGRAQRFIASLNGIEVYVDQWDTMDAEDAGYDEDNTLSSPAPFGDNTFRVIDEREGGVVAYFGSHESAQDYADFLIAQAV